MTSDRFFTTDRGWADELDNYSRGAKGELTTRTGTRGALFQIVAVDEHHGVGSVIEYEPGVFNKDLVSGRLHGYVEQIISGTGFANFSWLNLVMLIIGGVFIYLGIAKEYEPLLLVPIGFGVLIGNIPLPLHILTRFRST